MHYFRSIPREKMAIHKLSGHRNLSLLASIAIAVPAAAPALAETPYTLEWVRQLGTASRDFGEDVATDSQGNAFIVGYTEGDLNDNTSAGGQDAYLAKYDATGNLLWTEQLGTTQNEQGYGVSVDSLGNAYITGRTYGGLNGNVSAGGADMFVTKFNGTGTEQWTRQLGNTGNEWGESIFANSSGSTFVTGPSGDLDGETQVGGGDAFITQYNSAGVKQSTSLFGGTQYDFSKSITLDGAGNIYLAGFTYSNLGGGPAIGEDAFVTKFDSTGSELWTRQLGSVSSGSGSLASDLAFGVDVDGSGNVYISGLSDGNLDGNTGSGNYDAFLTKFDASGNLIWTELLGNSNENRAEAVGVDSTGNIFIVGYTRDGIDGIDSLGDTDIFLTKYDASGNLLWTELLGTSTTDLGHGISIDDAGNVFIAGRTAGSLEGNPWAGSDDAFIAKYAVPEPTSLALLCAGGLLLSRRRRG